MPPIRVYTSLPTIAEIQKIEGPIVIENEAGNSFAAADVGVACVIGETIKGDPNLPTLVTAADLISTFGGFSQYAGDGAAYDYDGNLFLAVAGGMKFSSLVAVSVDDRVGEVTLSRTAPGYATLTSTDVGPWALADGDTLIVTIEGPVVDGTLTINAEAASAECATAEPYDLTIAGKRVLEISVNGGPTQTATITPGDVVAIGAVTAEEIRDWANGAFTGLAFTATTANTKVTATTDRKGLSASLQVGGGMRSILGFTPALVEASQLSADNNVQDVDAVEVAELVTLLDALLSNVTPSSAGGALRFTRDLEGAGATVALSGTIPGAPAGKIDYAALSAAGGTGTAEEGTLPAGLLISDGGSNVFFLAEDVTFAEDDLSETAKIRQATGTTVLAAAINTIVSTALVPATITGLTVTNAAGTTAKPTTEAGWLALYQDAIDSLKAMESPSSTVNLIFLARHGVKAVAVSALTGSIQKALTDHCVEQSANGFPRVAIVSPPLATTKAIARSSSGVGVGSTTAGGRNKRRWYGWPGIQKYVQEIVQADPTSTGVIDWPLDSSIAAKASMQAPYLSLAEADDNLRQMLALETYYTASGVGGSLVLADYITNKAAGIMSPVIDPVNGPAIQSQATSVNPVTDPTNSKPSERRTRDWIELALVNGVAKKQSKLNTASRRRAVIGDINAFLKGLKDLEEIADYTVREATPAALKGRGILLITVGVQTLDHLDNIIFSVTIGQTVDVAAL